jgi:hypothetical protein
VLPPGSFVVVNCSSLYCWNAGASLASILSPPRIDLIALVTSVSYVMLETCNEELKWGVSEPTSPGGALSMKDERALSADMSGWLLRYCRIYSRCCRSVCVLEMFFGIVAEVRLMPRVALGGRGSSAGGSAGT